MELELHINGVIKSLEVAPQESLLTILRREGYFSVKHGCETGECGACAVLVDGVARPACVTLAAQAGGCTITTAESLAHDPYHEARELHPLQEAFLDTGAVQCGFCTPGMLLSALALLKKNPAPDEAEVREALSGNLCRCTGYVRPVQAVLRAAAIMRGEEVPPLHQPAPLADATARLMPGLSVVGRAERKVDAARLVKGRPAFVDDCQPRGMLYARILGSPHAHATIRTIDASEARALPGVHAVLTYEDIAQARATNTAETWPDTDADTGIHDQDVLGRHVRFVGDRVAVVAAETPEIAEQALHLIQVDYEPLPTVFDPRLAISAQAPRVHPEPEARRIYDAAHNIAAYTYTEVGNVEAAFAQADLVVEGEYIVPQVRQTPLETKVVMTYWDEDDRLVVRSGAPEPARIRRLLAPLLGLPERRIRVVRPGTGGTPGPQEEALSEDLCALLTIATGLPVRLAYSRAEELRSASGQREQIIHLKTGVRRDGKIIANAMQVLANTGAYAGQALNDHGQGGLPVLSIYPCANLRYEATVVYTNLPPAISPLDTGIPQGCFALESQVDEIARQLGLDALEVRRRNWIKAGDKIPPVCPAGQHGEHPERIVQSCGLPECLRLVAEKLQWYERRAQDDTGRFRRGTGVAIAMHSSASTPGEMAGASLKLNDDGSFQLLVGTATADAATLVTQIVAEILGVPVEDILLPASDTDFTPGGTHIHTAAALSATGHAAKLAAEQVREQILALAAPLLKADPGQLTTRARTINAPHGQSMTLAQLARHAFYGEHRQQIMATTSWMSRQIPSPSFAAQGVSVEVNTETGTVRVLQAVTAMDAGHVINPLLAEGQVEGGAVQALGYGLSEELLYNQHGTLLTTDLGDYRIFNALDMPPMETCLVETDDPAGLFGSKEIAGLPGYAIAPALANAVAAAVGVRLRQLPLTPERVLRALRAQAQRR